MKDAIRKEIVQGLIALLSKQGREFGVRPQPAFTEIILLTVREDI